MSVIRDVLFATLELSAWDLRLQYPMKLRMALGVSRDINVRTPIVVSTNVSHDTEIPGCSSKPGEVELENGLTVLACFAGLLEQGYAGFGVQRTMSGLRCTRSTKDDGYILTHVKGPGTTQGCTQKVVPNLTLLFIQSVNSAK